MGRSQCGTLSAAWVRGDAAAYGHEVSPVFLFNAAAVLVTSFVPLILVFILLDVSFEKVAAFYSFVTPYVLGWTGSYLLAYAVGTSVNRFLVWSPSKLSSLIRRLTAVVFLLTMLAYTL